MAARLFEVLTSEDADAPPAILLFVHVLAGAGHAEVAGTKEGALVVRVASPPRGVHANAAVQSVVATLFGVEADAVELLGGESRGDKRLCVRGITEEQASRILERARREIASKQGGPRRPRAGH